VLVDTTSAFATKFRVGIALCAHLRPRRCSLQVCSVARKHQRHPADLMRDQRPSPVGVLPRTHCRPLRLSGSWQVWFLGVASRCANASLLQHAPAAAVWTIGRPRFQPKSRGHGRSHERDKQFRCRNNELHRDKNMHDPLHPKFSLAPCLLTLEKNVLSRHHLAGNALALRPPCPSNVDEDCPNSCHKSTA
jgi:hypothetical protein